MIPPKYLLRLQRTIRDYFPKEKNRVFIFGSSLRTEVFHDIDVGVLDKVNTNKLEQLKEALDASSFPFFVDIVDFNSVEEPFYDSVVHNQTKKWI